MRGGRRGFAKRHWTGRAGATPPEADEELFTEPPGAEAVARRTAIIAAIVGRALIEAYGDVPDGDALIARDLSFVDELGLDRDAEPQELEVMRAPYGTLPSQATIDSTCSRSGSGCRGRRRARSPCWTLRSCDARRTRSTPSAPAC